MHRVPFPLYAYGLALALAVCPLSSSLIAQPVARLATNSTSVPPLDLDSPDTPPGVRQQHNFFRRLAQAYKDDWHPAPSGAPVPAAPKSRGFDGPLESAPFPSSDYSVGG